MPGIGITIPVRAAKAKLSALLELVARGQEIIITSDGEPKAVLSPVSKAAARPQSFRRAPGSIFSSNNLCPPGAGAPRRKKLFVKTAIAVVGKHVSRFRDHRKAARPSEPDSEFFIRSLAGQRSFETSELAQSEILSALLARERAGKINAEDRRLAWKEFQTRVEDEEIKLYPLNRVVLERATALQLEHCHPRFRCGRWMRSILRPPICARIFPW